MDSKIRLVGPAVLAPVLSVWALPLAAQVETHATVDLSVGASAATNPYFLNGSDNGAVGANLTVDPAIFLEADDTSLALNGSLSFEHFSNGYGLDESAQIGASAEHRMDERTRLTADLGFRTSESAARRYFDAGGLADLEPGEFPESPVIDPTLGGVIGRTNRLDVSGSVEHLASPNSTITAVANLGVTRVESGSGEDYRNSSLAITYSRHLTERTSLLTTWSIGHADYLGREAGDGLLASGLAGVDHQLSESLHLSAQIGASVIGVESLAGSRETKVSWAAELDACNAFPRGTFCVTGSRSAQPTSLGGLTTVSSLGASYAHSFGTTASLSVSGSYARSSRSDVALIPLTSPQSELTNVSGTYRHVLSERVSAFVTPSLTWIANETSTSRQNYQLSLGISYHFGRLR